MFPLIKQHSWVILPKTKVPCLQKSPCATMRTDGASGSLASSKNHSLVRRLTWRVKVKHKQLWIQSYTLNFEHILRAWVFHFRDLKVSIINFLLICNYYLLLFCSLFHVFSFSFTSKSLIPSALLPLTRELCILALPYTCKKRFNRLLIYTWDLGINSWIGIMGLGSSCSLRDVDLGKCCCSALWFPLWEESFSQSWGQKCSFLPESLSFFCNKKQAPQHTLLDSSGLKIVRLTAMHKRN